ncbi:zinc finger protein 84-like [Hyperolius riggenbachi]|uniref:zinc finger protein 84-like n=1 Tax=Hyperolius riggenbachi TaxID=752182 RepID=UPI0035A3B54A
MDKEQSCASESILDLTLEIIYLLTGEEYEIVKKTSGGPRKPFRCLGSSTSIPVPPPHSLTSQKINEKKILELTNKIIHLLTGEVPIKDVTITLSKEQSDYLEGHKALYKDSMMENQPPFTSPDGPSNRNPPERRTGPPYSREHTPEDESTPRHNQGEELIIMKVKIKEEEEERCVTDDLQCSKDGDIMARIKEEGDEDEVEDDDEEDMYLQDDQLSTEEEYEEEILLRTIKEEEEEMHVSADWESMQEGDMMRTNKIATHISDGHDFWSPSDGSLISPPDDVAEDNGVTKRSPGGNLITGNKGRRLYRSERVKDPSNPESFVHPRFYGVDQSNDLANSEETWTVIPVESKVYRCFLCDKYFGKKSMLLLHKREHTGEPIFSCSECGKHFSDKSKLLRHNKSHTGEQPFPCSECGKCFTRREHLLAHQRYHTSDRPFNCSLCDKRFYQKTDLLMHQRVHTGERPFSCSDCGRRFFYRGDLRKHEKSHKGERPFSCTECGKGFLRKVDLHIHQRSHTGDRPFSCKECSKGFFRKEHLIVHSRIHTGERPFSCSACEKCFTRKVHLLSHQKTHTGERPFSCSECDKTFIDKGTLLRHERSHTGERPYMCTECGKCFFHKATLIKHKKIHSTERPFSCSECGKGFLRKEQLIAHQRRFQGKCRPSQIPQGTPPLVPKPVTLQNVRPSMTKPVTYGSTTAPTYRNPTAMSKFLSPVSSTTSSYGTPGSSASSSFVSPSSSAKSSYRKSGLSTTPSYATPDFISKKESALPLIYFLPVEGQYAPDTSDGHLLPSPEDTAENDGVTQHSPGGYHEDRSPDPCNSEESSVEPHNFIPYIRLRYNAEELSSYPSNSAGEPSEPRAHIPEKSKLAIEQRNLYKKPHHCCTECGKAFIHKGDLHKHQRSHTGERPFSCPECGKCFSQNGNLRKHQRSHTGERPFTCSECRKGFIVKEHLLRHQKRLHGGRGSILLMETASPVMPGASRISYATM